MATTTAAEKLCCGDLLSPARTYSMSQGTGEQLVAPRLLQFQFTGVLSRLYAGDKPLKWLLRANTGEPSTECQAHLLPSTRP